jgi:ribose-phosphate pyrophosphokinase
MAACTHGLLSGPAYDRIEASAIERLIITDTIPLERQSDSIDVVSVSGLFAKAIRHIYTDRSVSTLFKS